jgi:hypothetical protein
VHIRYKFLINLGKKKKRWLKMKSLCTAASNGSIVPAPVMELMITCARGIGGIMAGEN